MSRHGATDRPRIRHVRAALILGGAITLAAVSAAMLVFCRSRAATGRERVIAEAASCGACCAGWAPEGASDEVRALLASAGRPISGGESPSAAHGRPAASGVSQ